MDERNNERNKIILILLIGLSAWWVMFLFNLEKPPKIDYVNDTPSQILETYNKNGVALLKEWYPDKENLDFVLKYLGRDFPKIDLKTSSGQDITNDFFKDKKTVVIIGASYCENCQDTSKTINGLYGDDIQSLYIYPKDNLANIEKYYADMNIEMPKEKVVLGSQNPTMSLVKDLNVKAVPLILYVDETGKISYVHLGSADKDELNLYKDRAFNQNKIYTQFKTKLSFE